jgi:hypothetical protein
MWAPGFSEENVQPHSRALARFGLERLVGGQPAISPVLLGAGEWLFEGTDMRGLGYECIRFVASEKATHVVLRRQASDQT